MVDYEMEITDYDTSYDDSSKFEFPLNPRVVNVPLTMDKTVKEVPYGLYHVFISGAGIKPVEMVLNGVFRGEDRLDDYNSLAEKVNKNDVQLFWLNSESFMYILGSNIRKTLNNERNRFVDWVANFYCVSPFVYKTSRDNTKNITGSVEVNSTSLTNSGNASSVPKITITNNSSSNITKIEIGDGDTFAGSSRTLTWSDSTGLASSETLVIYPFKMVNSSGYGDLKSIRFAWPEKDGSKFGSTSIDGYSNPRIEGETTTQVFSYVLTGCDGSTDVRLDWNDSYFG
jgi:phage-related protein